jgi:hypothetical protein
MKMDAKLVIEIKKTPMLLLESSIGFIYAKK